jgi:hypothetical protein
MSAKESANNYFPHLRSVRVRALSLAGSGLLLAASLPFAETLFAQEVPPADDQFSVTWTTRSSMTIKEECFPQEIEGELVKSPQIVADASAVEVGDADILLSARIPGLELHSGALGDSWSYNVGGILRLPEQESAPLLSGQLIDLRIRAFQETKLAENRSSLEVRELEKALTGISCEPLEAPDETTSMIPIGGSTLITQEGLEVSIAPIKDREDIAVRVNSSNIEEGLDVEVTEDSILKNETEPFSFRRGKEYLLRILKEGVEVTKATFRTSPKNLPIQVPAAQIS